QLFYWYLFKPLFACVLLWPFVRGPIYNDVRILLIVFLALNFFLNSRLGQAISEASLQSIIQVYEVLRSGLLPGLYRLVNQRFKRLVGSAEGVLFRVAEWLRFRSGDRRFSRVVRAFLGVLWYPVSFLARLYLVVLIEPGFNPIKAPLSILFAKIVYPLLITGS